MKILSNSYLNRFSEFDGHEKVVEINEPKLKGFIAIHNTNLGPAVGGTRFYAYENKTDALADVLRLSRGMTYKCAISRVRFGGGKAVVIRDPNVDKDEFLKRYAEVINKLNGSFYTGEDVGISEDDVQKMLQISKYFIGRSGQAGDPSPFAALSTYMCMKVATKHIFGNSDLKNLKIVIKGVGKVGGRLAELVSDEKANVFITDVNPSRLAELKRKIKSLKIINNADIYKVDADIYSPCAMGGEFTTKTMKKINARIICGAANNQLNSKEIGDWFDTHDNLYAPDYVVNSGGLINVVDELEKGGYQKARVLKRIKRVAKTLKTILKVSDEEKISISRLADSFAESIFKTSKLSHKYLFA